MAKKTFKLKHNGFKTYSTFQDIEYIEITDRNGTVTHQYLIQGVVMSDNKTVKCYRVLRACPMGYFTRFVAKHLTKDTLTEARKLCTSRRK